MSAAYLVDHRVDPMVRDDHSRCQIGTCIASCAASCGAFPGLWGSASREAGESVEPDFEEVKARDGTMRARFSEKKGRCVT